MNQFSWLSLGVIKTIIIIILWLLLISTIFSTMPDIPSNLKSSQHFTFRNTNPNSRKSYWRDAILKIDFAMITANLVQQTKPRKCSRDQIITNKLMISSWANPYLIPNEMRYCSIIIPFSPREELELASNKWMQRSDKIRSTNKELFPANMQQNQTFPLSFSKISFG